MKAETAQLPIRAEVYGVERLEALARFLAQTHHLAPPSDPGQPLLPRLYENARALQAAQRRFFEDAQREHKSSMPPEAEWLLDNFYIVQNHIQQIEQTLTPTYYRELPKLGEGECAGVPRVYALALELIAHTDSHLNAEALTQFMHAYQTLMPLTMGEVWGLPVMLRLGLIENLRRIIEQARHTYSIRADAQRWANRLLAMAQLSPTQLVIALAELAQTFTELNPTFVVQLLACVRDQTPSMATVTNWLEQWLTERGTSSEAVIRAEHQRRAANRLSIGNVITSLRTLSSIDWNLFFENVNAVEAVLRDDPAGLYVQMEFATRDHYRHVVERLSRRSGRPETEVAHAALTLAARHLPRVPSPELVEGSKDRGVQLVEEPRATHVGYYLIDRGRPELEAVLDQRLSPRKRLGRIVRRAPSFFYLGAVAVLTVLVLSPLLVYAWAAGLGGAGLAALAVLLAVPVSTFALNAADYLTTLGLHPHVLPKLDFQFGIPAEHRTMVVVPCLISSKAGIRHLCDSLERRYLANRDEHLHFALLGDFADATEAHRPEDETLLQTMTCAIQELNNRYTAGHNNRFYFFHRRRTWNAVEQKWMGWERKRGKLIEFNRLLRGATTTNYTTQIGYLSLLPEIRYVITLDADTELPINSARRLVGALAHPLNRPRLDPKTGLVHEGYGIIQPRTAITAVAASETRFARLVAHDVGLDPYARPVSMVYPDLFGSGSYIGKAIYDVDAALAVLADRFPENLLLSHDLIEGAHLRVGMASDIQLLEDFPSGYDAYIQRQHRWVRGDWQISAWLLPFTPRGRNPLPLIERWKIFDNLRQSLVPPALVLLLVLGWTVLPGSPLIWTLGAVLLLLLPLLLRLILHSSLPPPGEPWRVFLREMRQDLTQAGTRVLLLMAFLLFEALVNLDAIVRVGVRLCLQRSLLEWTSAAKAKRTQAHNLTGYLAHLWAAPATALGLLVLILVVAPEALGVALPLLGLWSLSPLIAYLVSQPERKVETLLPEGVQHELRLIARRIWGFFEAFAGAEDHWLPPDNYQHDPGGRIAHRTSPTNIGFLIIATLAAYDFGFLSLEEWIERLERILNTLESLERFRGHFLNWYDTLTLEPLLPKYVSTVDSGNLAACLIVLKQMCVELETSPRPASFAHQGLRDTATVLGETLRKMRPPPPAWPTADVERVIKILDSTEIAQAAPPAGGADIPAPSADWPTALNQITPLVQSVHRHLQSFSGEEFNQAKFWAERLKEEIERMRDEVGRMNQEEGTLRVNPSSFILHPSSFARLRHIAQRAESLLQAMDFAFLFHPEREVFVIGYNAATQRLDNSFYDLLASEARLASFVAIALGQVPARHWFRLSRPFTWAGDRFAALSWGGTMFEYLLPQLFMREFDFTLLEQTRRAAIQAQIDYGARREMPWGVSESGFYAFDYQLNYQYQLFGVPDLGLKQGLGEQRVVAPYATFLALPFVPEAAWRNLRALRQQGALDGFGFYEALDYTPDRRPRGQRAGIVRSFMAHHQGMSLAALDNYLHQSPLLRRFHADQRIAALELLLQERVPHHAPLVETYPETQPEARRYIAPPLPQPSPTTRRLTTPHTFTPRAQVLSNGAYQVIITNSGGGYSACQLNSEQLALTRWREDSTRDDWGTFIYLRDLASEQLWSATYQPTGREPEAYEVVYAEDQATFRRRDLGIQTQTEIVTPPHDNLEIRRLTLTNTSGRTRTLEVTSYAEVVLDSFRADLTHPAFSKLFIESEFLVEHHTLLFHRRARMADQPIPWAWHQVVLETALEEPVTCETDRARFIGRGRTPRHPRAADQPLIGTTGAVLDPIMSLRCRVRLAPGQSACLNFITGAATSREAALTLVDKYSDPRVIPDAFGLAQTYAQIQLRHIGLTPEMTQLFQRLASRIIYPDAALRAPASVLIRNTQSQSGLWGHGLSGDSPIVLVRIDEAAELELVRHLLHAHEYWRLNNFGVDLVILNEHPTSYAEGLHGQLQAIIDSSLSRPWLDRPGGVFLRRSDHLSEADYVLLNSLARVVLDGDLGSLIDQLQRSPREPELPPYEEKRARPFRPASPPAPAASPAAELLFPNPFGGFAPQGREYVITLSPDQWTPAPWINVLANPAFGCLVSESGLGYTWSENSQANRLTPWSNDPISDPPGEAVYLRDDDTGDIWTPTPLPIRLPEAGYVIRHGAGYSRFESTLSGLAHDLLVFVPTDAPVKIARLRVRNPSTGPVRHLALTHYIEWVLGLARSPNQHFIVTEYDSASGALFARNTYNPDFGGRIAFTACLTPTVAPFLVPDAASPEGKRRERRALRSFTADRCEFLGRNGSLAQPAALQRGRLSERVGAGLDPCAAQQIRLELKPGEEKEVIFLLGQAESREQARVLIQRYSQPEAVQSAFEALTTSWEEQLGVIQVQTPEPGLDLLLNHWLLYQTLACRLWARSAFYQSGGAYGFRDQLQDVMALTHARPDLAREHILRAAAHQFVEGDVQHWWHPHGPGVRTRFSDDYLWLPFVVHHYVRATGDTALLDEKLPYLKAPLLEPEQLESYMPHTSPGPSGSLYEHCCQALDHGLKFGEHGLPLIGIGDWNDAMNRVGYEGRGESVWLGWFLYTNLQAFAEIAQGRNDLKLAERYRAQAERLHQAIEANAWDGEWYRRAYFDDGTPLGSAQNAEGQIDLIAQAWAVLSGAAGASPVPPSGASGGSSPADRVRRAFAAVEQHLVREPDRLVLLLTPPFDKAQPDPGYIRGYLPGIRENGGQYTHAALWLAWAYADLGEGDRAAALFNLLNPIYHARSAEDVARYKVEPYVVAADVYAQPQHLGRGGWTWYTGSASWMYRLGVEAILGLRRAGETLHVNPCIPKTWLSFKVSYRFGQTRYEISVENPQGTNRGVAQVELDDVPQPSKSIPLRDDHAPHRVRVVLG